MTLPDPYTNNLGGLFDIFDGICLFLRHEKNNSSNLIDRSPACRLHSGAVSVSCGIIHITGT